MFVFNVVYGEGILFMFLLNFIWLYMFFCVICVVCFRLFCNSIVIVFCWGSVVGGVCVVSWVVRSLGLIGGWVGLELWVNWFYEGGVFDSFLSEELGRFKFFVCFRYCKRILCLFVVVFVWFRGFVGVMF